MNKQILIIATSHARLGNTGKPTGLWAEELAAPYYALTDAGAQVTIATPLGGAAPFDPASLKPPGQNDAAVDRLLADEEAMGKLSSTRKVGEVDAATFDALFFPGGHGAMWDLPDNEHVARAVEQAWAAGKIVAAVCHGVAGLVSARRADGRALVEGLRVNAFTNAEEEAAGLTAVVPFALETRLRELGARFESEANWAPFAVRDGRLITGQNPQSSVLVAGRLVEALGD